MFKREISLNWMYLQVIHNINNIKVIRVNYILCCVWRQTLRWWSFRIISRYSEILNVTFINTIIIIINYKLTILTIFLMMMMIKYFIQIIDGRNTRFFIYFRNSNQVISVLYSSYILLFWFKFLLHYKRINNSKYLVFFSYIVFNIF